MTRKLKICLTGASGVGKTSLMKRFVHGVFSDRYQTTIGVKIESRRVTRGQDTVDLVIWDISGEDEFQSVQPAYLVGSAGYLLVVDGTRHATLETALALRARVRAEVGDLPYVVLLNKADLIAQWDVVERDLGALRDRADDLIETSARTGSGVARGFDRLLDGVLARAGASWT